MRKALPRFRTVRFTAGVILLAACATTTAAPDEPSVVRVHTRDRAAIAWLATQRAHLAVNRAKGIVTVDDIVDHTVSRVLDQFGLDVSGVERWSGEMGVGQEVD